MIALEDFHWLIGLLEGEGTFLSGVPSAPDRPRISLVMTDRDVVERAAQLLCVSVSVARPESDCTKSAWSARLSGKRAQYWMSHLLPYMSARRQTQIRSALQCSNPYGSGGLTIVDAKEIRRRVEFESPSALAVEYGVSRRMITWIRQGVSWSEKHYPDLPPTPKCWPTIAWLGGLLEGEGSFQSGTPSQPNRVRVSIGMSDEDVIAAVAGLWGVAYQSESARSERWKPIYRTSISWKRARDFMQAIRPRMGSRRQREIDIAVSSYAPRDSRQRARLTPSDLAAIRLSLKQGVEQIRIAEMFGVSRSLIAEIKRGTRYAGV